MAKTSAIGFSRSSGSLQRRGGCRLDLQRADGAGVAGGATADVLNALKLPKKAGFSKEAEFWRWDKSKETLLLSKKCVILKRKGRAADDFEKRGR